MNVTEPSTDILNKFISEKHVEIFYFSENILLDVKKKFETSFFEYTIETEQATIVTN